MGTYREYTDSLSQALIPYVSHPIVASHLVPQPHPILIPWKETGPPRL